MMGEAGKARLRIGVLVSGRGSNLQAILDGIETGTLAAEVAVVISNRAGAPALERAAAAGVPAEYLSARDYPDRAAHHRAIAERLRAHEVDLIVTAGFNRVLDIDFVAAFRDRIINVHPSLLPAFGGTLHAQAEALAHGVKITGCTVHFVDEHVDAGPIIAQRAVPVLDDDTEESLSTRILQEEHALLPTVLQWFAEGRVRRDGRQVRVTAPTAPTGEGMTTNRFEDRLRRVGPSVGGQVL
jgi:phosphoribosylglycinamide formyltransferase-1